MPTAAACWPETDASLELRFACCTVPRPARLVARDGAALVVVAPLHPCPSPGRDVAVHWVAGGSRWQAAAAYAPVAGAARSRWRLTVQGDPEPQQRRHPRLAESRMVRLWKGGLMVPARMVDRSEGGMGCTAGRMAPLRVGDVVDVDLGDGTARISGARVVRARGGARTLDVGLAF